MSDASSFTKLVPGFDFLQGLVKNAGAALPGIGQWVAPTIDPAELEKRIEELRTVQFWLEQNAKMLGATIQALEVQRMTLSTLKTMNVQMETLRDSLQIRMPEASPVPEPAPAPSPAPATEAIEPEAAAPPPAPGAVDPMQWWGALTKQFADLATNAMKDSAKAVVAPPEGPGTAPTTKKAPAKKKKKPAAKRAAAKKTSVAPRP